MAARKKKPETRVLTHIAGTPDEDDVQLCRRCGIEISGEGLRNWPEGLAITALTSKGDGGEAVVWSSNYQGSDNAPCKARG